MNNTHPDAQAVLDFWFSDETQPFWFAKSDDFDRLLAEKFAQTLAQAAAGELAHWRATIEGRLAEIIVLDQFSRNLYRDTPQAFAQDSMAVVLTQEALKTAEFAMLSDVYKHFLLMPLMHSESKAIHEQAVVLFGSIKSDTALPFELKHKVIIDRFGRYPHRNAILGRVSTPQEIEFLKQPDSSF